jgi:hypothetical protein
MTLKDSGQRQEFGTGSVRDTQEGKGRYDLLPTRAIHELAQHFQNGGKKYGDRNWENGQPLSRYLSSGLRHAFQALQGETDENHAVAAAWNLMCFLETRARIRAGILPSELDDLPKAEPTPEPAEQWSAADIKLRIMAGLPVPTIECPQCRGTGDGLTACCGMDDCSACLGRGTVCYRCNGYRVICNGIGFI